jgi:hypothetical protein
VEVCSADRIKVDGLLDMSPYAFRTRTRRTWASDFRLSDSMLHVWSFLVLTTKIPSLSVVIDFLQDLDLLHRYTTSPLFKTFI